MFRKISLISLLCLLCVTVVFAQGSGKTILLDDVYEIAVPAGSNVEMDKQYNTSAK